ncbi:MAG: M23 family metallopeptidase [Labilithrix sp.]|nr:M23 family metallopeptidase [Labilithrix sp.]
MKRALFVVSALATIAAPSFAIAAPFSYEPAGTLVSGSGTGRADAKVYAPDMRFPMETGPAFANSQVWGRGGLNGPGGGQCDAENFSYPWHDNYCESRSWQMPLCPSGTGHQGQDIRAADCKKDVHWVVAAVDGTITNVGSYSVYLTAADGTRYDYLHMSNVQVTPGQKVVREQRIGKVSNQFGGEVTTVHLHFNVRQNVAGLGAVYVPTYMSLVSSYEDLLGLKPKDAGAPDVTPVAPPKEVQQTPIEVEEEPPPPPAPVVEAESGCTSTRGATASASTYALVALGALVVAARRRSARRDAR